MSFDFQKFPELRNEQIPFYYWESPHKQIFEDFTATCITVHDGDTITVQWSERDFPFPIRFAIINAPELNEEGGQEAKEFLRTRIEGEEVTIAVDPSNRVDKYGRLLGRVSHRGLDMGEMMMATGHAKPLAQKNEGRFPPLEKVFSNPWQT